MSATNIEWTDRTWNPVTGCTKVSQGCKHCYAEGVAHRFWKNQYVHTAGRGFVAVKDYNADQLTGTPRKFTDVLTHEDRLVEPLTWRKPARVFVNSMSDLFHEDVPDAFIDRVFAVMALAWRHTFQILTKRPARMREYCSKRPNGSENHFISLDRFGSTAVLWARPDLQAWPLPNVWLGVSVEDQATADQRIPLLLDTPAAVRFVSYEPALGPVNFHKALCNKVRADVTSPTDTVGPECNSTGMVDWVIVGGESGPEARTFEIQWARSVVRQCRAAGVSVFVKQLGSHAADIARPRNVSATERAAWVADGWCRVITNDGEFFTKHPRLKDRKGGDPAEWPEDLRVREFPR